MSLRAVYSELRALRKELARERARRNQTLVPGIVEKVKGDKVMVRLMDAGSDGKPVLTPFIRMASNTGNRGKGVSEFTKYGVGETVLVVSPNGKLGTMSAAMPWISTGDDPAPGAAENDAKIIQNGSSMFELRDGLIKASVGGTVLTLRPDNAQIDVGGASISVTEAIILLKASIVKAQGTSLIHNVKNVGDTHTNAGLPVD